MPKDADGTWMSTQDTCKRLGITLRTLYRMIDEGQIPAFQFGRVFRLQRDDVEAFIESSRIKPGSLKHLYPPPKGKDDEGEGDDGEEAG